MIKIVLAQGLRYAKQILPVLFLMLALAGLQSGRICLASAIDAKQGIEIPAEQAEGLPIGLVYIHLEKSTGASDQDAELTEQVASTFSVSKGEPFRQLVAGFALKKVRQLAAVQSAELRLYSSVPAGQLVVAILVSPQEETATVPQPPKGMVATGTVHDFPTIYEDDRSKFVFILNGGVGIFSDSDPWFGGYGQAFNGRNPTAEDPSGEGTTTWLEGYIEPGIGGISQLFDSPLYAYGAVSYLLSGSNGQDIYNSGTRGYGDFEKLYAGLLWDLPGKNSLLDASFGKQTYQVRDGFLLSKIPLSTSIGERAALYLGPRLTSEYTALLRAKVSSFGLDAFLIEPSEIDKIASDTQLAGVNLQYNLANTNIAFSYFYIPESKSSYVAPGSLRLPREGLRTFNPSLSIKKLLGRDGAWLKAEYAYQNHEGFDMSAQAGYAWIGYQAGQLPWKPQLSYRWSLFSGDDPNTRKFERFDPLFSGGLGNFLPGIVFSKVYKNANLVTNRATFSVKPTDQLELILDYLHHRADDRNNLGGIGPLQTLASKDVGQEVTLTAYNYIGRHLFLQGIASVGIPGEAINQALGGDAENWYTLQAALYFFF
ncbi:Alginate export [Malonomonas rubra DSM 5091]|uniref:Alginate export n=1 Tax=Malonomonas rubra DSM 5091 TaxID=1122189 RepID=A0A1M6L3J3_MALRU|nr:alginate export family protein [Malonomonas rubra]SHJ65788.1 Alginate export [Malonomonas rubra DSM 5091]